MRKPPNNFRNISSEIAYITAQREALVVGAFDALEFCYPALAQVLLESFGSRQRASHWICGPQRALRFGRDSGNFRRTDNKSLRLQGKFDVFGHGTLVPIQVQ